MSGESEGLRIDVWLWRARFFKSRSLATTMAGKGKIRVTAGGETRRITKASALVRPGDTLTLLKNGKIVQVRVLGLPDRRGPAAEAQTHYELVETPETPDPASGGQ